jgi:hypothetical protein
VGLAGQESGCHAVVSPPVIRELEVVLPLFAAEAFSQLTSEVTVTVDLPIQSGNDVKVRHEPGRDHAVSEIVNIGIVTVQPQPVDAPAH